MAYLVALGILALIGIVATIALVRSDGYGSVAVDPSRVVEPDPRPGPAPAAPTASVDDTAPSSRGRTARRGDDDRAPRRHAAA